MTSKKERAQEKALEALVAASLRCPDKLPDITEDEIRRFVEQKITLSPEDEAALAKSKPGLMQAIGRILKGNTESDEDCVRGSGTARSADAPIPGSLARLAEREHLTPSQTHQLLDMKLQIRAHRSSSRSDNLETFDWGRFYTRVKGFLK
jgi:hypothetical protein